MKRELALGVNAVLSLLEIAPERIVRVWLNPSSERLARLGRELQSANIVVESCEARALDRRADGVRHQGVIAEFRPRAPLDEAGLATLLDQQSDPLLLVLDGVSDPHNLGACIRSAAAVGASAVVVPKNRAAGLTPVTRRAAAGATERIPLAVITNLARTLRMLGERGFWRVGLAGKATKTVYEAEFCGSVAVVMGGEERGMRRLTREQCDEVVGIPMPGDVESLNVSVAAGVVLFEAVRARNVA
ncbi:MAG: 23S rRNA (guanosine(2251)-2'-O)-methyltransferase RlmB [Xanthomonadaceae bacterium]|nr:23S rRNA (guanosine(2251)-2'-O)-methyltransferase RlmB [Xanthomonadaceae bacterium]